MRKLKMRAFGKALRYARGRCGLREAAKQIGTSAATLSRVERGATPDLETFAKLCDWLDVDPGEFLGFGRGV